LSGLRFVFVEFMMNVLRVLYDLSVWSLFFVKMFMFCINFQLWFCFGLVLGQTLGFGFVHDWTNVFGSTRLILFWVKHLKLCLYEQLFVKGFFFFFCLRWCLANTLSSPFSNFLGKENIVLLNITSQKYILIKKNQKMIFFLVAYGPILTKIAFYLYKGEKNVFNIVLENLCFCFCSLFNLQ